MVLSSKPVGILGAFIGNGIDQITVWTPTLDKIMNFLEQSQHGIMTIEGCRHVMQMFVGGMTQFFTEVQCMLKHVCKHLQHILCGFHGMTEQIHL